MRGIRTHSIRYLKKNKFLFFMDMIGKKNNSISLCMIVKYEEKCLACCLDSVKNFIDEIIIVDTGSVDKTIDIAEEYTKKIFHYDWHDDFSAARNFSLSKATKDWILMLDADEIIVDGAKLQAMAANDEVAAWNVKRVTAEIDYRKINDGEYMARKMKSSRVTFQPRLFKNKYGYHYKDMIHEYLVCSKAGSYCVLGESELVIQHRKDEEKQEDKDEYYNALCEKLLMQSGDQRGIIVGRVLNFYLNKYDRASFQGVIAHHPYFVDDEFMLQNFSKRLLEKLKVLGYIKECELVSEARDHYEKIKSRNDCIVKRVTLEKGQDM